MTEHENVVTRRAADVALLHRMVEIPSVSGEEGELARYLCGEMAARGLRASIDEVGNAVGEAGEGGPLIVLLGHMDTVGGVVPVRREGTLLYGRGAVDAKGPLATFLAAASAVAASGNLPKRIVLVGAVEEETATSRGARHILHRYAPDYVVIGEPSGWSHLTIGYKGRLLAHYHLRKAMQHTAAAGPSACEDAVAFWNRVAAWCEDLNRGKGAFDSLTPSLRAMHSSSDGLVEEVRATLGFRLPPGISPAEVRARLESERGLAEVVYAGDEQAVRLGKSNPLVRGFLGAIRARGGTPGFKVKTGTSDMNVVASGGWECPMLAYGPGDSSLDHTPQEHIDLDEYGRAIDVLTAVLEGL